MDKQVTEKFAVQHIVAAVDFSAMTESVVMAAAQEAQLHQAQLSVLHVFNPQMLNLQMPEEILPPTLDIREKLLHLAHAEMNKLQKTLEAQGLKAEMVLEESADNIGRAIADYGKAHKADLLVVGSHGHSGLERLLLGSVANGVLNHAHCAVLVIKALH
ncbi:universal stress protein [Acidithiobacillus sp. M4-SHS-6]|uniref:universal stress protein n=1 Tax=Acidithiobacillus sp. M4-SHS-6 TaxID=3383024 RepID=UPI0039BDAE80